mgnify:CR=1 FL=1
MPLVLVQRSLAIIGLGCIVGAADSWLRPTVITLKDNAPAAPGAVEPGGGPMSPAAKSESAAADPKAAGKPAPLGLMIDSRAAKALFDQGVVFLDARIQTEYDAGHIPQAYLLNSSMFGTPAADEAMKAMDPAQPVVIYCGGGECDASKNVAILLQHAGFKQIHIIEKGYPEWVELGYPIDTPQGAVTGDAGGKP